MKSLKLNLMTATQDESHRTVSALAPPPKHAPHQNLITLHNTLRIEKLIFYQLLCFYRTVSKESLQELKSSNTHIPESVSNSFVTGTDFCCNFNIYFPEEFHLKIFVADSLLTDAEHLHNALA